MTENIFKSLFIHVYTHIAIFKGLHKSFLPEYCHMSEVLMVFRLKWWRF